MTKNFFEVKNVAIKIKNNEGTAAASNRSSDAEI